MIIEALYTLQLTEEELEALCNLVEYEAFALQVGPHETELVRKHTPLLHAILQKLRALRAS